MNTESRGVAVVTGASSGIGAVYADRLARRGYDLLLAARSREAMSDLARNPSVETGRQVQTVVADLTDSKDLAELERILREDAAITLLVNNAGMASTAPLLNADVAEMSRMISLNVNALTRLTYAAVPPFVKRGSGTIINIGSIVGVAPEVLNGVYGGTKAFVLAFSQSLRKELEGTGLTVQAVLPGATATDLWKKAGTPVETPAAGDCHAGGRHGRCSARRPRSRRICDDPRAPGCRPMADLRGRASSAAPQFVSRGAGRQVQDRSRSSVSAKC